MSRQDLAKEDLLQGVRSLISCNSDKIQLNQTKLYTVFSIAFQYFTYLASKEPGHYILRIEDSYLLDKLTKKSKDQSTRRTLAQMTLPRRIKIKDSFIHLDFFALPTWAKTSELPKEKILGALIVKNAYQKPISFDTDDEQMIALLNSLPKDYPITTLSDFVPKTLVISLEENIEGFFPQRFDCIKEDSNERLASGVSLSREINLNDLKD